MGYLDLPINFEAYKKEKYGTLDWSILKDYKREEDFVEYHEDDKDLGTIRIYTPTSPDWRLIDGYGLPAAKQKFQKQKMPHKLDSLYDEFMRDKLDEKGKKRKTARHLKTFGCFLPRIKSSTKKSSTGCEKCGTIPSLDTGASLTANPPL